MEINGLSLAEFSECVTAISRACYDGNVVVHGDAHDRPDSEDGTRHCTARLAVRDSHGQGSRTSWNGRHGPYACWHAYRDVLLCVFASHPDAVIRAGQNWRVTYRGWHGFMRDYPETGSKVIGSEDNPVTMPELCNCPSDEYAGELLPEPDSLIEGLTRHLSSPSLSEQGREALSADLAARIGQAAGARPVLVIGDRQPAFPRERPFYVNSLSARMARRAAETAGIPGVVLPEDEAAAYYSVAEAMYPGTDSSASYVSPAVERASRAYAASERLLGAGDKPADPTVFGPEYAPADDPQSYR